MNDSNELEARLDRMEAMVLSLREQLAEHGERMDSFAIEVARLERAVISGSGEVLAALVDLRSHLVDLTLDGYYPTRLPPSARPRD